MAEPIDPSSPINAKLIAQLLHQHADALRRYAAQWTATPEDCVQEAFVELAGQKQIPDSIVAWLYRVVRNRAINRCRGTKRRKQHEQAAGLRLQETRSSSLDHEQRELTEALQAIDDASRELVTLRIWSGLTWSEIGGLTGQSSSSAQRNYVVALAKLKQRLESECPTTSNYRQN